MLHVWMICPDRSLTAEEDAALLRCLPPERRSRLERRSVEKRDEVLLAYGLLRALLFWRYGWRTLPVMENLDGGKPYFPAYPTVCFSLSHSAGAAAAAISDRPVGVDIQRLRPVRPETLARLGGPRQTPEAFFQSWVRWEARAKRTGGGLWDMVRREPPLQVGEAYSELDCYPGFFAGAAAGEPLKPELVRRVPLDELLI